MNYTSISFMSTLRHNMNIDLKLLKDYFSQNIENVSFRYFINDGTKGNYMVKSGQRNKEINFADKMDHAICIDPSIPVEARRGKEGDKRIMIALPFETQFKALFSEVENKRTDLSGFTHVVAGSPFGGRIVREIYNLGSVQVVENVMAPFSWEINQPQRQACVKKRFIHHYPGMKDRKVLAVLTTGKVKEGTKNPFEDFDLASFLKKTGEEWFLITNNTLLLEKYATLSSGYMNFCGYIDETLPPRDILYFADVLVTNSSMYSYYFASRKKPLFIWDTKDSFFKEFVIQNYPELVLKNAEQFADLHERMNCLCKGHEKFCGDFSYELEQDPCEKIRELLLG